MYSRKQNFHIVCCTALEKTEYIFTVTENHNLELSCSLIVLFMGLLKIKQKLKGERKITAFIN